MAKHLGKGTKLWVKDGVTWRFVSQLKDLTQPGITNDVEETTVHDTEDQAKTYVATLQDNGEAVAMYFADPDNITAHAVVDALVESGAVAEWRITYPTASGMGRREFLGFAKDLSPESTVGGLVTYTLTVKITGAITDAAASVQSLVVSDDLEGVYVATDEIVITATFDEIVRVTGTPRIAIVLDSGTVYAEYESGSNTAVLTFSYEFGGGDQAEATEFSISSPIDLNSGTLKDAAGSSAVLTFIPPDTTAFSVNAA